MRSTNSSTQRVPLWQRVKTEISIVQLAERYAELRRSGNTRFVCRCLCGHNTDRHPSFTLYAESNDFHCFACQAHGSVIDLEMLVHGLDFRDACAKLARDFGLFDAAETSRTAVPHPRIVLSTPPSAKAAVSDQAKVMLNAAVRFYTEQLTRTPDVRRWLTGIGKVTLPWQTMRGRGLSEATLHALRIGYASGEGLARSLFQQGFSLRDAQQAGLLKSSAQRHEPLRERVIFPVLDSAGDAVYLMGRAIRDDQQPKYLGLSEGSTHKQPMVWGEVSRQAVLVEGCFDVAALKQWHIDTHWGVIGLLGTAHEQLLAQVTSLSHAQMAPDLVVLDQDWAGKRSALSVVAALAKLGRRAYIVLDLDRHMMLQHQSRFASAEAEHKVAEEIALGNDMLRQGLAKSVRWGGRADSPGKLLQLGLLGHELFMQALH